MADLLAKIKQGLDDGSLNEQASPIVDEAMALVNNHRITLAERLPKIYQLIEQATAAGGADTLNSGYIIEALYAQASKTDMSLIEQYNQGES